MHELTRRQAQSIVDKMMRDIPYNINIMDRTGIIIGSGNPARIGTMHHGAAEAIAKRESVEIDEDAALVKKVINLPIEWKGEVVGVVGISGEVEETRPFGNLVRTAAVLLLEQSLALEKKSAEEQRKQELFHLLAQPETAYTTELAETALAYGIRLDAPSVIVYTEWSAEAGAAFSGRLPSFNGPGQTLFTIVQSPSRAEEVLEAVARRDPGARSAVSGRNNAIAEGISQARHALRVLKGISAAEQTIRYDSCPLIVDLSQRLVPGPKSERLVQQLEQSEELIPTLQAYFGCNLNANETAKQLMIHRNTLQYRLSKIESLTGRDPKRVPDLVELLFLLIHRVS